MFNTSSLISQQTQRAIDYKEGGYLARSNFNYLDNIKQTYKLDTLYRFDLGQSDLGCSQHIYNNLLNHIKAESSLAQYPQWPDQVLSKQIVKKHHVTQNSILFTAGLEQMLSSICKAFLNKGDYVVQFDPSFFVFETFSKQHGAQVIHVPLTEEDGFKITWQTYQGLEQLFSTYPIKIIWLANPNNPTGQSIPNIIVEYIIKLAYAHNALVVIDEAYAEYIEPPFETFSASQYCRHYPNVIVGRTFSKAYGLANIRLGYAIVNNDEIAKALRAFHCNFPLGELPFHFASYAYDDQNFLEYVKEENRKRMTTFAMQLEDSDQVYCIPSGTNLCLLKHSQFSAKEFSRILEQHGIIVSLIPGHSSCSDQYVRVAINDFQENQYFIDVVTSKLGSYSLLKEA